MYDFGKHVEMHVVQIMGSFADSLKSKEVKMSIQFVLIVPMLHLIYWQFFYYDDFYDTMGWDLKLFLPINFVVGLLLFIPPLRVAERNAILLLLVMMTMLSIMGRLLNVFYYHVVRPTRWKGKGTKLQKDFHLLSAQVNIGIGNGSKNYTGTLLMGIGAVVVSVLIWEASTGYITKTCASRRSTKVLARNKNPKMDNEDYSLRRVADAMFPLIFQLNVTETLVLYVISNSVIEEYLTDAAINVAKIALDKDQLVSMRKRYLNVREDPLHCFNHLKWAVDGSLYTYRDLRSLLK